MVCLGVLVCAVCFALPLNLHVLVGQCRVDIVSKKYLATKLNILHCLLLLYLHRITATVIPDACYDCCIKCTAKEDDGKDCI